MLIECTRINDDTFADPEVEVVLGDLHDVVLVLADDILPEHLDDPGDLKVGSQALGWNS